MDTEKACCSKSLNEKDQNDDEICMICKMSEKNELFYGEFIVKGKFSVHYFCLLSTTRLLQQGKYDKYGIYGFLFNDISRTIEQIKDKICHYCGKNSAGIECAELGCYKNFHFICGTKNECVTEFIDCYYSYCHDHLKVGNKRHEPNEICKICLEEMGPYSPTQSIMPTCCYYGFFHKKCMIRFASEAGYYTNCPFCADKNDEFNFLDEIRYRGVFIPQRDASWETEKDAYSDMVKNRCFASDCPNPKMFQKGKGEAVGFFTCVVCGCFPMHLKCLQVPPKQYHCQECKNKTFLQIFKKPSTKI